VAGSEAPPRYNDAYARRARDGPREALAEIDRFLDDPQFQELRDNRRKVEAYRDELARLNDFLESIRLTRPTDPAERARREREREELDRREADARWRLRREGIDPARFGL
jgi:hypothetical protein